MMQSEQPRQAIFDTWAKELVAGSLWWPSEEELIDLLLESAIYEQEIIPQMAARGWYYCINCNLWHRDKLDAEELCLRCRRSIDDA